MLNKIIDFSIKNKLIIGLMVLALIGYGIYELQRLPIDAVPDITNNQVQVITVAPALGATDIERLITFPIEQANNNLPHLKEIRSFSTFGLSVITIVLEDDVDLYWARQQISERLLQVQDELPKGFGTPFLAPVTTGLGEIYQYVVKPKKGYENQYTAMELRTIQDWIIRKQLLGVEGVADVSSFGGLLKQYEIAVEPEKLYAYNITIADILTSLEKNNENTGGAYIEKGYSALFIRSEGLVGSLKDIENIVIKNLPNGVPLLIRDVAEVRLSNAIRYGALTYNGELQVSGAVVMMLKGANSNQVISNIKNRIEKIKKTLPEGVTIEPFIDRTKMVNNAINTVSKNLIEGALIVIFVLILFLGNLRAGLLVASVIPLSMLFAVIMMNLFRVSGNLMSLGALDFGLIVDGAVIIVEVVLHQLTHTKAFSKILKLSQDKMDSLVNLSASKMMNSAVFGQVIILMVYLPIFSLEGIEGKMFKPMAQTVAFALIGAFLLSITYIPMMSSIFLSKKISSKKNISDQLMNYIELAYQKYLIKILRYQKIVLTTVILLFLSALYILTKLGGEFIPSLPEGDFAVEVRILPGSNLEASIDVVSKASKILLKKFPEVERIVTKTGSSEVPTDPMPLFGSDMIVVLKNRSEWTSASTYQELESKMIKELEKIPGVDFSFQYPVAMRFNELISGAKQDVVCKIFGDNMDTLEFYANKLGKTCNTIEGISGLFVETVAGVPQISIQYNRNLIAQYGLNIKDINEIIYAAFAGKVCGIVYENEKRFDMVVRLKNEKRKDLTDIKNLLIPISGGQQIPLSNIAQVEIIEGPYQIQRENSQRRILVGFNVRGRDVQSIVQELQSKVEKQFKLPVGYTISYGGAFENLEAAKQRLSIAVPVSLALIFILLFFAFHSIKLSLLIYSAIPLSAIGGIFALAARDFPFSISAGVGFIALFGVSVLNGIVLIAEFNSLKKEGYTNLQHIVIKGTKVRLRPVLMTALVASLGFLPMALSTGEGAEVQRPLATVVIGGLLIATFLTLFILPILYILFCQNEFINKKLATIFMVFIFFANQNLLAQTPITLKKAIDTALENNLFIKKERLKSQYQNLLLNSATIIPKTNFLSDYGQINSFYHDIRIGVSQTLNFPSVYKDQKNLFYQEWKSSLLNVASQEAELKLQITKLFYSMVFLQKKKQLLLETDSIFIYFLNQANNRLNKGESNILENINAENQRGQILLQIKELENEWELLQMQFQLLLNTTTVFIPDTNESKLQPDRLIYETKWIETHPSIQYWKQQEEIARATTQLERSKLYPDLLFGYNLMGMRGLGADNKEYNGVPRFQSIQVGLGISIFSKGQRAKIQALKNNEIITNQEQQIFQLNFENMYKKTLLEYQKLESIVNYYETTALKNANLIIKTANEQFLNGEINYLEWVLLVNQAIAIKKDYIEAVKNRNHAIAELNYFINQ